MRKFIAIVLMLAFLFSVASCKEKIETSSIEEYKVPVADAKTIINEFLDYMSVLANMYETDEWEERKLEDGTLNRSVWGKNTILESNFHFSVSSFPDGKIKSVFLSCDKKDWMDEDTEFPLLAYYAFRSLQLSNMEADVFYESLNLLTESPGGTIEIESWKINVYEADSYLYMIVN